MPAALPDALPLYGVQLADAYLMEARVSRRPKEESDVDGPTLDASHGGFEVGSDEKSLDVRVGAKVQVPYRDGAYYLELECSMHGRFIAPEPKEAAFWAPFAEREALVMLWPYVRATISELGRMTALPVPVLPTLDVAALVPPPEVSGGGKRRGPPATRPRSAAAATG